MLALGLPLLSFAQQGQGAGVTTKWYKDATPQKQEFIKKAPAGAPNVVWILLDDVGYGALSAFGGLINKRPAEATWCGDLISAAPDLGMKCDPAKIFGLLPQRYNQSRLSGTNAYTDIMSITPQVARRAYLDAARGSTSTFFYVRSFVSTTGGPDEYVAVTIRLSGNGSRVPLSLTEVKLSWGVGKPVLFIKTGERLPQITAEIR